MFTRRFPFHVALAPWVALMACSGAESPSVQDPAQSAGSANWNLKGTMNDPSFAGGRVLALNERAEVFQAEIQADQRFALELPGGSAYALHFLRGGEFAATMFVQRNRWSGARTKVVRLPSRAGVTAGMLRRGLTAAQAEGASDENDGDVELGGVQTEGGIATPENEPGVGLDSDGDGVPDIDDPDDDGDGVPDELEAEEEISDSALGFVVSEVDPEPGEDDADADEEIEIGFSRPIDPTSIHGESIRITDANGQVVPGVFEVDDDSDSDGEVEFLPEEPLAVGSTYTIHVTTAVTSSTGEPLARELVSTFCVECNDDDTYFRVKDIDPADGEDDVEFDEAIEIEFSQHLDPASATVAPDVFELLGPDGAPVSGMISLHGRELRFSPAEPLLPESSYTIHTGTGLTSESGSSLDAAIAVQFRTGATEQGDEGADEDDGDEPAEPGEPDAEDAPSGDEDAADSDGSPDGS